MIAVTFFLCLQSAPLPIILPRAHSHNDYYRKRPLLDALDAGFMSVEADVFLADGKLLVGHSKAELKPERTLEALYLKPLSDRIKKLGWVHPTYADSFWVLVDIKENGKAAFARLLEEIGKYPNLKDNVVPGRVRFVISGDRPVKEVLASSALWMGLDGRFQDDFGVSNRDRPWVSDAWSSHFKWRGEGVFPDAEQTALKALVSNAHESARKIRFWGAPDRPEIWAVQAKAGVDWINTDRLADMRAWMIANNLHVANERTGR